MSHFPYKIIDLTHTLSADVPTWDLSCGFDHKVHHDYDPAAEFKFKTHKISMHEGIGTHMDAPAHCIPGTNTVDKILLNDLVQPCVVLDVLGEKHELMTFSLADIEAYEKTNGRIESASFVLVRTGWEALWSDPKKYHNNHRFPSISREAAELLVKQRNISGIGIDTLSPDRGDEGFHVHQIMLNSGKIIVENAANLNQMPVRGAHIMIAPLKIAHATEAPVRLMGFMK